MRKLPAQPNQSLVDGITILQALAVRAEPASCTELAKELGLELTRVNRLVKTLHYLDLVYRTPSRKYACGPGMHGLAIRSMFGSKLFRQAIGPLSQLTSLGHIVALGVLWQDTVSYLFHYTPGIPVTDALWRLSLYPASESSIGMILLAEKEDQEIRAIYHGKPVPGYQSMNDFMRKIRETRKNNYGLIEKRGHRSLATTLGEPAYAGIALSGDFPKSQVKTYLELLIQTAKTIAEGKN